MRQQSITVMGVVAAKAKDGLSREIANAVPTGHRIVSVATFTGTVGTDEAPGVIVTLVSETDE